MYQRWATTLFLSTIIFIHSVFSQTILPEKFGSIQNTFAQKSEYGDCTSWKTQASLICGNTSFANTTLNSTNQTTNSLFIGNWGFTTGYFETRSRVDWVRVSLNETTVESTTNIIIRLISSCGTVLASLNGNETSPWQFNISAPVRELIGPDFGFEIAKFSSGANVQLSCISMLVQVSFGATNSIDCTPSPVISGSEIVSSSPTATGSNSGSPVAPPSVSLSGSGSSSPESSPSSFPSASGSFTPSVSTSSSLSPSVTPSWSVTPSATPTNSIIPTPEMPSEDSSSPVTRTGGSDTGPIIGGVVGAVVALCAVCGVLAFLLIRRKKKKEQKKEDIEEVQLEHADPVNAVPIAAVAATSTSPYAVISTGTAAEEPKAKSTQKGSSILDSNKDEIYITDVKLKGLLGKGKFGEVYEGLWSGTTPIALKKLKQEDKDEFENEIVLLRRLNHPNVVRCLGIWVNPQTSETFMALELLRLGSLTNFLRKQGTQSKLSVEDLVEMCINVASGMIYLEQKNIVHRDLGSRNLLVTETDGRYVVKVSDFGLSRQVEENDAVYSSKEGVFPVKWSPPEVINFRQFTSKSDVWSFGITMWEIFEFGRVPYPTMSNEECVAQVMKGYRLPQPDTCPDSVYTIMTGCWNHDQSFRPSFKLIHESLTKVLKELRGEPEDEEVSLGIQEDPDKNYRTDRQETYNNVPKESSPYETYNNNKKVEQEETYNNNQKVPQQDVYNNNRPRDDLYNNAN